MTARAGSDTDFPNGEHSEFVDRPVTESVTARAADTEEILVMNVSTVATEESELREVVLNETDKRGIPVYSVECTTERRRPENISAGALQHAEMSNNQRNCVDYCCGVCGKGDSVKPQSDERLRLPTTCDYLRPAVIVGSRSDFYHNRTSSHTLRSLYDRSSMIVAFWSLSRMQVADCCTAIVRPSYDSL